MARLELLIDVLDREKEQLAAALPDLRPGEFIEAILAEFQEIEYLSRDPWHYRLRRVENGEFLDDEKPLEAQLTKNAHVALVERPVDLPPGTSAPPERIYLREQSSGAVYPLRWLPAILGRLDSSLSQNELVAVNLEPYTTGLRVSRRHARIDYESGAYVIDNLSNNGTTVITEGEEFRLQRGRKRTLQNGDLIRLDRSELSLRFMQLEETEDNSSEKTQPSEEQAEAEEQVIANSATSEAEAKE